MVTIIWYMIAMFVRKFVIKNHLPDEARSLLPKLIVIDIAWLIVTIVILWRLNVSAIFLG